MKTYQAFAKTKANEQLTNTEIKAENIKKAREWFKNNTIEHEKVHVKK